MNSEQNEIYSKVVRAGKRTYFFDIKATKGNDLYITLTESKKTFPDEGGDGNYQKHKIFLYKEDFEKFFIKGNKTAGTRIRKTMQMIRKAAENIRKDIQDYKKTI